MAGVHPQEDLAPRDVVAAAISRRMAEAPGGVDDHVFLDATHMGERFYDRFPSITAACRAIGIDPARDRIPVAPAAHYACGGVPADLDGTTALAGLFAVGEVACTGVHGANRLASQQPHRGRRRRHPARPRPGVGAARRASSRDARRRGRRRLLDAGCRGRRSASTMSRHVGVVRDAGVAGGGRRRARRRRRQASDDGAPPPARVGGDEPAHRRRGRRRRRGGAHGEPRLPPPHRLSRAARRVAAPPRRPPRRRRARPTSTVARGRRDVHVPPAVASDTRTRLLDGGARPRRRRRARADGGQPRTSSAASTSRRRPPCPPTSAASARSARAATASSPGSPSRPRSIDAVCGDAAVRRRVPRRRRRPGRARRTTSPGSTAPTRAAAHRRAHGAQPAVPPLRRRHAHPPLGRRPRRHRLRRARHAQDDARAARPREVRRALRRRRQPPHGLCDAALVKDNHVLAAGGVAEAFAAVRALDGDDPGRDRGRLARRPARGASTPAPTSCCSTTSTSTRCAAAVAVRDESGRAVVLEASGGLTLEVGPARSARPASTTSPSASSPTRPRSSTSASTSAPCCDAPDAGGVRSIGQEVEDERRRSAVSAGLRVGRGQDDDAPAADLHADEELGEAWDQLLVVRSAAAAAARRPTCSAARCRRRARTATMWKSPVSPAASVGARRRRGRRRLVGSVAGSADVGMSAGRPARRRARPTRTSMTNVRASPAWMTSPCGLVAVGQLGRDVELQPLAGLGADAGPGPTRR